MTQQSHRQRNTQQKLTITINKAQKPDLALRSTDLQSMKNTVLDRASIALIPCSTSKEN
ncbi:hypothetical protein Sjap_002858 [Stephania japonica]|uniref:Uncharacterized protein n=1 Tax=Stephania japonica TaxID=461633 RepID=A0AAP0PSY4_9MAGN